MHDPAAEHGYAHGRVEGPGYEVRDTNVRAVVMFTVGLVVFLIVSEVGLGVMIKTFVTDRPADPPKLTAFDVIAEQRQSLKIEEDVKLGENARLPIEAAMDRITRQGVPPISPGKTSVDVNGHAGKALKDGAK